VVIGVCNFVVVVVIVIVVVVVIIVVVVVVVTLYCSVSCVSTTPTNT
jgi:hypothetical protein